MVHFIVGTIAASLVMAGFVIGLTLIFKKNNKKLVKLNNN